MAFFSAFKLYCIESRGENTDRSSEILTAMAQYTEASTSRGGHNLRLRESLKDITNYNAHMERKDVCLQVKSKHLDTKLNNLELNEEDGPPIKKRKISEPSPILLNELKDPDQRVIFFFESDITITSIDNQFTDFNHPSHSCHLMQVIFIHRCV